MTNELNTLQKIKEAVYSILSKNIRNTNEIQQLSEIIKYHDVLYFVWKSFTKKFLANKCSTNIYISNVLDLLKLIVPPKIIMNPKKNDSKGKNTFLPPQNKNKKFVLDIKLLKKFIRKVWVSLVNRNMNYILHKELLLLLLRSYLSIIENPVFLTDYLMASMNIKGIISILALEGVSQLMQKHNIEYPNVYGKLYTMFTPDIFHKKFKFRLFNLANIFLSSIYLPESIVASFVKRLARLGLFASASDIPLLIKFIGNLLIRHPSLRSMIHNTEEVEVSVPEDPFLMNENDPTKTNAIKSSLWEIVLLKNHCLPSVSSVAKFIDFNLPSIEYDLNEVLNQSYEDLFDKESKKQPEKPSINFERPQNTIAKLKDDKLYKLWCLN